LYNPFSSKIIKIQ